MNFKRKELVPQFSSFKECIIYLMKNYMKLSEKYIDKWTTPENMKSFEQAFTHESYDDDKDEKDKINSKEFNYEFFELVGDSCLNKNIVYYLQDRFPQFRNAEGVKYITKMKLHAVSKANYHVIADSLGIYPWIRASKVFLETQKYKLLEDCFEAFVGAFELMVNRSYEQLGCSLVYPLVKTIFDKLNIPTTLRGLSDNISQLKEAIDDKKIGKVIYEDIKIPIESKEGCDDQYKHQVNVYIVFKDTCNKVLYGTAIAFKTIEAKKVGASQALDKLRNEGKIGN
jgi:dsRNA-specific ribonuclease